MRGNEITEIITGTFEKIGLLEYLKLEYNKIENLGSEVFSGLTNLIYIYIHLDGNKLQYLHQDTFVGLPKLKTLYFSNISGLHLPTDRNLINSHSLTILSLSHCNVRSVSVVTFANVSALEWLDLSYNKLRSLDINVLNLLPKLYEMYLNRKGISEIITGTLEKTSLHEYLSLEYNKIERRGK
jgi:Leucine-rich repeat (LRR) protein